MTLLRHDDDAKGAPNYLLHFRRGIGPTFGNPELAVASESAIHTPMDNEENANVGVQVVKAFSNIMGAGAGNLCNDAVYTLREYGLGDTAVVEILPSFSRPYFLVEFSVEKDLLRLGGVLVCNNPSLGMINPGEFVKHYPTNVAEGHGALRRSTIQLLKDRGAPRSYLFRECDE